VVQILGTGQVDILQPPYISHFFYKYGPPCIFSLKTQEFCQFGFHPLGEEKAVEPTSFHPPRMLKLEEIKTIV
jgi:hypothetical protein